MEAVAVAMEAESPRPSPLRAARHCRRYSSRWRVLLARSRTRQVRQARQTRQAERALGTSRREELVSSLAEATRFRARRDKGRYRHDEATAAAHNAPPAFHAPGPSIRRVPGRLRPRSHQTAKIQCQSRRRPRAWPSLQSVGYGRGDHWRSPRPTWVGGRKRALPDCVWSAGQEGVGEAFVAEGGGGAVAW